MRRLGLGLLALASVLGLLSSGLFRRSSAAPAVPCPASGTLLAVRSASRSLHLCRAGRLEGAFRVAIGRAGLDKRSEGDGRTPRGHYTLGVPRASQRFHLFVPVGYPTEVQRNAGWTGSAIGVHGPDARLRWLGPATVWVDWTAGCVAVGTREEIEEIADWVRRTGARTIAID